MKTLAELNDNAKKLNDISVDLTVAAADLMGNYILFLDDRSECIALQDELSDIIAKLIKIKEAL